MFFFHESFSQCSVKIRICHGTEVEIVKATITGLTSSTVFPISAGNKKYIQKLTPKSGSLLFTYINILEDKD